MIDDLIARLRGEYYRVKLRLTSGGRVQIGRGFKCYAPLDVGGTGRIVLGDDVTVRRDAWGSRGTSLQTMYTPDASIEIGSGVMLLKGAVVGKRAVVRPGSVIMRPTAPGVTLSGFPARPETPEK